MDRMDIEQDYDLFRRHHRDRRNVAFHVACGLACLSCTIALVGPMALVVYGVVVTWAFRKHASAALVATAAAGAGAAAIVACDVPVSIQVAGIVVAYLLPELSHWLVGERGVLDSATLTPVGVALNFLLLLPYSIACLQRSPLRR